MRSPQEAFERANALRHNMDFARSSRSRVRAILDGGPGAIRALLGDQTANLGEEDLPWENFMLSAITALAQKLGHVPEARVPPPHDTDNEAPRRRAEKRERIVTAYDEYDRMEMQLPQTARWLPGYGFAVWTINSRLSPDGYVYPCAQLRDPYDAFPGEWGVGQQPEELAICRRIPPVEAARLYPNYAGRIQDIGSASRQVASATSSSGWANQTGRGLEVVEYYDRDGCHILIPEIEERVDFHVNPLSTPAFVVAKRFAFNQLIGQYDHMIGLLAALAKLNILYQVALEDAVFSPTNIFGDFDGQYRVGRFDVNKFAPGSRVEKPSQNLPYQAFEGINRLERMARVVARYPIQDDGNSPLNFATGAGLEELQTSVSAEVKEYQTVYRYALQDLDAKRLEWDEMVSPNVRKPIAGMRTGVPHAESYTPAKDIKGDYRTRREFGFLEGFDEPQKIVAGGQMLTMGLIDRLSFQEKISGLDDVPRINQRIVDDKMRDVLHQALLAAAQQGDPKALMIAVEALPAGEEKDLYKKYFTPDEPQMSPEEEAMAGVGGVPSGPPPDITTVLSQLSGTGSRGGIQTISRV